jgi:hypothetical protein
VLHASVCNFQIISQEAKIRAIWSPCLRSKKKLFFSLYVGRCGLPRKSTLPFPAELPSRVARWYIFTSKNSSLGKFWRTLESKMLEYFMTMCNILRTLAIFDGHLAHVVVCNLQYFSPFWYVVLRKILQKYIGQPCCRALGLHFLLFYSESFAQICSGSTNTISAFSGINESH